MFNKKDYYSVAGISAEDIIDGLNMLHREGAAVKYLFRNNLVKPKGETKEDLKKCLHYLHRCLEYDPPSFRENNADYYLEQINFSVFPDELAKAIKYLINAVGNATANYRDSIEAAINYVEQYRISSIPNRKA